MSVEEPYDDSVVVKVVHASHHQGSERYGNPEESSVHVWH